jgi:tetratricopeptide (TPR) repeat protein
MHLARALCLAIIPVALAADNPDPRAELRAGHVEKAIELLRAAISKQPADLDSNILLGDTLLFEERFDEAAQVVNSALASNPQAAGLHRVLGDLRYREGLFADAEKDYKSALKLDPKNARAMYGMSRVCQASCLRKKAADLLRVAHAIDFHDPVIVSGFEAADRRSSAAITRMEAELGRKSGLPEDDAAAQARLLKRWIAEAKALGGKAPCELAAPYAQYKVPFFPLRNGRHVTGAGLPVRINDAKANILLDTGADGLMVDRKFAERAGLQRIADTEVYGVGNEAPSPGWIAYVPSLEIGGLEFRNCLVTVNEKSSKDEAGLLGSDIFQRFLVKMDFTSLSLDLSPLPGPPWDGVTPVDRYDGPELAGFAQMMIIGHDLLIPTVVGQNERTMETPGLFLLDTGANLNMISTELAPTITKVHDSHDVRVKGVSGRVKMVYEADKVGLQFAGFRQQNLGLIAFDLRRFSRASQAEISGIMGMPLITLFQSVTLDYRDGRIKFVYKP